MSGKLVILLVSLSWLPATALAQAEPGVGAEGLVGATVSARAGITWLGSYVLPLGSLAGTLRVSPSLELGAEGIFALRPATISPPGSPDRLEMSMAYGGLLLRWRPTGGQPGIGWGGSLHMGAGTARVRSPLAELASENFYFFEPELQVLLRQDRRLRLSGDAGYRVAIGTRAIPGLDANDFRGPVLSLTVQLVSDP